GVAEFGPLKLVDGIHIEVFAPKPKIEDHDSVRRAVERPFLIGRSLRVGKTPRKDILLGVPIAVENIKMPTSAYCHRSRGVAQHSLHAWAEILFLDFAVIVQRDDNFTRCGFAPGNVEPKVT